MDGLLQGVAVLNLRNNACESARGEVARWMAMGNRGRFGADAKNVSAGEAHWSDAHDTAAAFTVI